MDSSREVLAMSDRDAPSLIHLACRLRKETYGCREWDAVGVAKYVGEMRAQGWSLAAALEQVLRRATDPTAKTPAALLHKISSPLPSERGPEPFRPPRKDEACPTCGGICPGACVRDRYGDDNEQTAAGDEGRRLVETIRARREGKL
jgi:hypothetical protein